jgi:hypothetical protein
MAKKKLVHDFKDVHYARLMTDSNDVYHEFYEDKTDCVAAGDPAGERVATYKLVKVERLALRRTTELVKA